MKLTKTSKHYVIDTSLFLKKEKKAVLKFIALFSRRELQKPSDMLQRKVHDSTTSIEADLNTSSHRVHLLRSDTFSTEIC